MRREAPSNSRVTWRSRVRSLLDVDMADLKWLAERTREGIAEGIAERIAERIAKSLKCLLAWKPEHGEVERTRVRNVQECGELKLAVKPMLSRDTRKSARTL